MPHAIGPITSYHGAMSPFDSFLKNGSNLFCINNTKKLFRFIILEDLTNLFMYTAYHNYKKYAYNMTKKFRVGGLPLLTLYH